MQSRVAGGTLSDEAYGRLRHAVLRGDIRPNERLVEAELAERLGISRTPIRDGLQRLAADGLVVSRRRGWVVREHTPAEITEIYEVRAALESTAVRLASQRADDATLTALARATVSPAGEVPASPRLHLVELNDAFHEAILDAAANARLAHLTRHSREYFFNHDIAVLYSDDEARTSLEEHRRIAHAMADRDAAGAEAAMRDHIAQALELIMAKRR